MIFSINNPIHFFRLANRIFVSHTLEIKKSFNDMARLNFGMETQSTDFSQGGESANIINTWVEENTNNKIRNVISSNLLNENTSLVLVNTIYFKGLWLHPFDRKFTEKKLFYLSDTETITVDFMRHVETKFMFGKINKLNAIAVELPYKEENFSMMFLLPDDKNGLAALEAKLATVDLSNLTSGFTLSKIVVQIPRFRIEFDTELAQALKKVESNFAIHNFNLF